MQDGRAVPRGVDSERSLEALSVGVAPARKSRRCTVRQTMEIGTSDRDPAGPRAPATSVVADPLPYLARAGEILAGSLDLDQTVECLLDLVVPSLADLCAVHLLDAQGR